MKAKLIKRKKQCGSVIVLLVVAMVILAISGAGLLTLSYGVRHRAIRYKSELNAMLAAEAGYERAIFEMSQQQDLLAALAGDSDDFDPAGQLSFSDASCSYQISFDTFLGARPIYNVVSVGNAGMFTRSVAVKVVQAVGGWDMGMCRVPVSSNSTYPVYYAAGEILDIPIHINTLDDNPDERDIYIKEDPRFLQHVSMGEARYTSQDSDKYSGVMDCFEAGIYFGQPDSKITDEEAVAKKVEGFEEATKEQFRFEPVAEAPVSNPQSAVHLEFFVQNGVGKVRITDDCTVRGFKQSSDSRTYDYRVTPGSDPQRYERYYIYAYHLIPDDADATGQRFIVDVEDTYVSRSYGGVESEPGGQIFVDGNVIIGSGESESVFQDVVKGKMTVVATGNIWIADSITVDGEHDDDGIPTKTNPNVFGLIARGVIRVVDPGMADYSYVDDEPVVPAGFEYVPIGLHDGGDLHKRHLPASVEIEAAITSGGGGFGAENVRRSYYGGRKESSGNSQDYLYVRGTLAEVVRGVVGLIGSDGFLKRYYLDDRMLQGILPGDIWLKGKYIPAPAGWSDYRVD